MRTGACSSTGLHSRPIQKPRCTELSLHSPRLPSGFGPLHEGMSQLIATSSTSEQQCLPLLALKVPCPNILLTFKHLKVCAAWQVFAACLPAATSNTSLMLKFGYIHPCIDSCKATSVAWAKLKLHNTFAHDLMTTHV